MTVGLLHALFAYRGRQVTAEELAERACTIEIERCGKPIGKQDQYIAAFGGIRDIRFGPGDEVVAEELALSAAERRALQQQIMLFYTGITRSADTSWPSRPPTSKPPARSSISCATWPALPPTGCAAATWTRSGPRMREGWEAKRKLASASRTARSTWRSAAPSTRGHRAPS